MVDVVARAQALLLSTVVTRVINAPDLVLSSRRVGKPERVLVPTRHGDVPCYITRPAAGAPLARSGNAPPVHVNIHGGAFLIGAPRQDDHLVRGIAGEVGATVVNIDYSTAPKARFPQAHEECYDVLKWVQRSGSDMGWDDRRVSIGGGSAGANLALGALELARRDGVDSVRAGVLIVPTVDMTIPPQQYGSPLESPEARSHKPFVSPRLVRSMLATYYADASRRADVLASPGLADEELAALPPLLVIGAEYDSLRPQIEQFVEKAHDKGASVDYRCLLGVDHDFPVRPRARGEQTLHELMGLLADHLSRHLT